jgi:putative spermidine/putrescine transport system substrate-binding protein
MSTSLRGLLMLGAIGCAVAAAPATAQQTFYVAGYGGSFEQTMRKEVIPQFESRHNVRVEYVAGNSTDTLAKLQAQRANQQIDVAFMDDGPMYMAIQLGFCAPIESLPADDIVPAARFPGDRAVGVGIVGTGLMYNTQYFKERGWAPPSSWNDLADPKFRQLIVIPPINNTYGLHTLVMFARMNGGGEANIEPGFKAMTERVNPNVLAYEPSPGKMTELFQSGQAALAVWGTGRVAAFAATGFPVDFVYPKEGTVTLLSSICPIAKQTVSPTAQEFVRAVVQPELQALLAREYGYGPVNKRAPVDPAAMPMAPVGERAAQLITVDWDVINQHRDAWTRRWNREVER